MKDFTTWLEEQAPQQISRRLRIGENFFPISAEKYDELFTMRVSQLANSITDPDFKFQLNKLVDFRWTNYIRSSVRAAGIARGGERDLDSITHEIVTKLVTGTLFKYDLDRHGPFEKRFKTSVANAIRNFSNKLQTQKRHFPSTSIFNEPGSISPSEIAAKPSTENQFSEEQFRQFVQKQLGGLAVRILDARFKGENVKSLISKKEGVTSYRIKETVKSLKEAVRQFAIRHEHPSLVWRIDRLLDGEYATIRKRFPGPLQSHSPLKAGQSKAD